MAEDLNRVMIIGRLTRDMELKYSNSGYAIGVMSIASNKRRKVGDDWVDEGHFFDVTLFGKRAESLAQYLTKGTQIAVDGQLKQDRWEQDGIKRSKVTIEANNIQLLGSRNSTAPTDYTGQTKPAESKERFEDDPNMPF